MLHQEVVSSRDMQRARKMAQRSRTLSACEACKTAKTRCNDFRPCCRCRRLRIPSCLVQTADNAPHFESQPTQVSVDRHSNVIMSLLYKEFLGSSVDNLLNLYNRELFCAQKANMP